MKKVFHLRSLLLILSEEWVSMVCVHDRKRNGNRITKREIYRDRDSPDAFMTFSSD